MYVSLSDTSVKIRDGTHRSRDDQGYLIVKDNPIAVSGVFSFLRQQVDANATSANGHEVVQVLRSPESLQHAADMFCNKPIVHHHKWVGKDGERANADGTIGSQVYYKDGALYSDLIIYNPDLIDAIESGTCKQLSPGYNAIVTPHEGVYDGKPHSFSIQYTGVNHLGVVENGRAGAKLSIQDTQEMIMDYKQNASNNTRTNQRADIAHSVADKMVKITSKQEDEQGTQKRQEAAAEAAKSRDQRRTQQPITAKRIADNQKIISRAERRYNSGNIKQEDYEFIYRKLSDENKSLMKRMRQLEYENKQHKSLQDKAIQEKQFIDTLATIHRSLPEFKAFGERNPSTLFSRAYQVYTGRKLEDGCDPRTAFLEASRVPRKFTSRKVMDNQNKGNRNAVEEALHKWHLQRQAHKR